MENKLFLETFFANFRQLLNTGTPVSLKHPGIALSIKACIIHFTASYGVLHSLV